MPAPQRTARIEDDIWDPAQERAKAEGASLGALMRAAVQRYADGQMASTAEPASQAVANVTSQLGPVGQPASQAAAAIGITADGEPCPGVACSALGCRNRDTARYGLRAWSSVPPAQPHSKAKPAAASSPRAPYASSSRATAHAHTPRYGFR